MNKAILGVLIGVAVFIVGVAGWIGIGWAIAGPTGDIVTEQRQVPGFTAIEVHGAGTLIITQGSATGLVVEGKRRTLDRLHTTVQGETLILDVDRDWYKPWSLVENHRLTYRVTVTDLTSIEAHGATIIQAEQALTVDDLDVSASGSSDVHIALNGQTLNIHTSGSSDVYLSGSADVLDFSSGGSADLHALDFHVRTATLDCSGSSDVDITVSEELNVHASGSTDVSYAGEPRLNTDLSGSSDIERIE